MGSLISPANKYRGDAEDGAYGLLSLSEYSIMSNYFRCLSKGSTLLSYSKTLRVGPVWGLNPQPSIQQSGALQPQLNIINDNHQNGFAFLLT